MLTARDLHFAYARDSFTLRVPELVVQAGELLGLGGPSGTGKTTLLKLLCGILTADTGKVLLEGTDLLALSPAARRAARLTQCGVVFQEFALLDYLTVEQNVLLPLRLSGRLQKEHAETAKSLVDRLEVGQYWKKLTGELSQGERQRVAIARALVHKPKLVLADEPTSSLDGKRKLLAMDLLTQYARENGAALVMVTHDPDLASRLERVVNVEAWTS